MFCRKGDIKQDKEPSFFKKKSEEPSLGPVSPYDPQPGHFSDQ
jgi:hypothetical protein